MRMSWALRTYALLPMPRGFLRLGLSGVRGGEAGAGGDLGPGLQRGPAPHRGGAAAPAAPRPLADVPPVVEDGGGDGGAGPDADARQQHRVHDSGARLDDDAGGEDRPAHPPGDAGAAGDEAVL